MVVKERDFALNIVGLEGIKTPLLRLHLAGAASFLLRYLVSSMSSMLH